MANKKILVSLTTITPGEWRNKVKEIDELGLKEIALFPTCLEKEQRLELYGLLEKTGLKEIPHVHLRDDMKLDELDYLSRRFGTKIFNVHSEACVYPYKLDYKDFYSKIYVENTGEGTPTENDLKKYAGLCLDLSHWHSYAKVEGTEGETNKILKKYAARCKIGLNHISAVKKEKQIYHDKRSNLDFCAYDCHLLDAFNELDYVKSYRDYCADIISIELENSLKKQLEVKEYLEKIL